MSTNSEISTYFSKTISGFVANKFRVDISAMGMETLRFYVKKVSIPYETLNFVEDIYVSATTLARPRNVISVQTPTEASFTFRMDPENDIIKKLETLFTSTHNVNTFEATLKPTLFDIKVTVYGGDLVEKYSSTLKNCSLVKMETYDLDASDRKLKEYSVTFLCNRVGFAEYSSTSSSKIKAATTCQDLIDKYRAAMIKYKDSLNSSERTSLGLTTQDVDRAFSVSSVISTYVNLINNATPCRWKEKFPIGRQLTQPIKDYIHAALIRYNVPADYIDFSN